MLKSTQWEQLDPVDFELPAEICGHQNRGPFPHLNSGNHGKWGHQGNSGAPTSQVNADFLWECWRTGLY
ncbi:hypothetical protein AGIG_G13185 [Arapaima gigas]